MICFLFSSSHKVMITSGLHQLVYFIIITVQFSSPDFHCLFTSFGNKAHNANFTGRRKKQNLHFFVLTFSVQNIVQKPKLYFHSNPHVSALVSCSHIFYRPRFNSFMKASLACLNLPCSRLKGSLGHKHGTLPYFIS